MSLLNDALRAAEQRQQKPAAPAAYTGQGPAVPARGSPLVPVLVVLVIVLAVVAGYALFAASRDVPGAAQTETPDVLSPKVKQSESHPQPRDVDPVVEKAEAPVAEKLPDEKSATASRGAPLPALEPKAEPRLAPASENQVAEKKQAEAIRPEAGRKLTVLPETEPAQVKEVRETPESIDRRMSLELVSLTRESRFREAGERLRALLAEQQAPISRATLARALLVADQPEIALAWLPAPEIMAVPELRLLRARALLATGDLSGALAVLSSQIPPLKGHIEYRVTLATLLQQAGHSSEAAEQWSALLTVDDSRAAWWVGLGVALESQGKAASAQRAYTQAEALPGLSPSLADYVRERLKRLQAG